jgi:photosynthetic reaction center cytochrome c subunit
MAYRPSTWSAAVEPRHNKVGMLGDDSVQTRASPGVKLASLPYDALTHFLLKDDPIRVNGTTALPTATCRRSSQTEWTYALMFQMSRRLGVNCTFCHNTRAMASCEGGPPRRVKAWRGIRMARQIVRRIEPLKPVFPDDRLGPAGDPLEGGLFRLPPGHQQAPARREHAGGSSRAGGCASQVN